LRNEKEEKKGAKPLIVGVIIQRLKKGGETGLSPHPWCRAVGSEKGGERKGDRFFLWGERKRDGIACHNEVEPGC